MSGKIILSADSTCDIGSVLAQKYDVKFFNYHILLGDKTYIDMIEIMPEQIFATWHEQGILPKTAAINPAEYHEFFKKWVEDGYEVIHLNLGSALSSAHQNCRAAADELGHVYPVDSESLSSGVAHLVVLAGEMIKEGLSAAEIAERLKALRKNVHASFILNTLEFMRAGGRCNAVTAFSAELFSIKPCIEVDNAKGGAMGVGKKYRGSIEVSLEKYIRDKLYGKNNLCLDRIFITHSGSPDSDIELAKTEILKYAPFKEIYVTRASGTISSHCGPRTLGILFMTND